MAFRPDNYSYIILYGEDSVSHAAARVSYVYRMIYKLPCGENDRMPIIESRQFISSDSLFDFRFRIKDNIDNIVYMKV